MNWRNILSLSVMTTFGLAFLSGNSVAQPADMDGVKAASKAFYAAYRCSTMERPWRKCGGIRTTSRMSVRAPNRSLWAGKHKRNTGWTRTSYFRREKPRCQTSTSMLPATWHGRWVRSPGDTKMKDGAAAKIDYIVTNVYEKLDGRWLIVSHHVQPKPQ